MKKRKGFQEEIMKNATILYTDNNEEHYDAIRITDNGVHIGQIIDKKFEPFGFIPNHSIKEINNGIGEKRKVLARKN